MLDLLKYTMVEILKDSEVSQISDKIFERFFMAMAQIEWSMTHDKTSGHFFPKKSGLKIGLCVEFSVKSISNKTSS